MLTLPTPTQEPWASWLLAVAAPPSVQQAPLANQLAGVNGYVLLMIGVLLVALLVVAWMARGLLRRASELASINQRLQGELADREDFAQQLQQLNSQLEQRTAEVQRLSLAVEHTPASVVLTGRNARIDYVNPSFVAQTGYTAAEVIGKNPRILQSGLHPPEYYAQMWRTLTNGDVWRGEMCNRDKHGKLYWEDTSIAPIRNDRGRISSYVAVKIDITARKQAEEKLQAAKLAAEEATRAKSQFLASMSHELRTPLNGVIGMMELLAGTELSEHQRQLADTCRNSGESLLYLINDILDFSKIEAGKLDLERHDFELEKLITDTLQSLHWRAAEKGLAMPCQVAPMAGLIVNADSNRLRQVLVNLLGNAVKFTPAGEVTLDIQIVDRQADRVSVRFAVSDTGVGIADDQLAKLFQPFSQADASTTRNYGGTGLGLTISQSLVELMGGTLEVESQLGVGSRFWFQVSFPVVQQAADQASPTPCKTKDDADGRDSERKKLPSAPLRLPSTTHVLLAEDNTINQMYMTELFKQMGVRCDLAGTGRQACDAVRQRRYDLVLMDCQMPDMDGFEATRQIRRWEVEGVLAGHLPVVALTAMAVKGDRQRCLDAGMDEYLSKPVQRGQIVDVFQRFLAAAEAEAAPPPPAPFHVDALLERCFHDLDFACTLLDELAASGEQRVQTIRQHAQRREAAETAQAAHSLKGAAGILCANAVQRLAAEIEQAGRSENIDDIDDTLNRLQAEMQRCLDYVPQLRSRLQTMVEDA